MKANQDTFAPLRDLQVTMPAETRMGLSWKTAVHSSVVLSRGWIVSHIFFFCTCHHNAETSNLPPDIHSHSLQLWWNSVLLPSVQTWKSAQYNQDTEKEISSVSRTQSLKTLNLIQTQLLSSIGKKWAEWKAVIECKNRLANLVWCSWCCLIGLISLGSKPNAFTRHCPWGRTQKLDMFMRSIWCC